MTMAGKDRREAQILGMADPLVRAIYYDLRHRPQIDIILVYRRLCERFPAAAFDERHLVALDALRHFWELTGDTRSRAYDAWAKGRPPGEMRTRLSRIVRLFGTWTNALMEAGLIGREDPRVRRMLSRQEFSFDEVLEALRYWASQTSASRLKLNDYLAWANEQARSDEPPAVRLPLTGYSLRRHGHWWDLLEAIDEAGRSTRVNPVTGNGYRYTPEEIHEWLRLAYADLKDRGGVTLPAYLAWRGEYVSAYERRARPRVPWHTTILGRYEHEDDPWIAALIDAGVPIPAGSALHSTKTYSDDELLAFLIDALRWSAPERLSTPRYRRWREAERLRRAAREADPRVPPTTRISQRLGDGDWTRALVKGLRAAGMDPALAWPKRVDEHRDEDLREALICAMLDRGPYLHRYEYEAWADRNQTHFDFKLPHYNQISRHLGDGKWTRARAAVGDEYLKRLSSSQGRWAA